MDFLSKTDYYQVLTLTFHAGWRMIIPLSFLSQREMGLIVLVYCKIYILKNTSQWLDSSRISPLFHVLIKQSSKVSIKCSILISPFNPWFGKILWRREWQPTQVFWLGKSHGQRNLLDYSPWGHKQSDMTEETEHTHTHTHTHTSPSQCLLFVSMDLSYLNINNLKYADDITLIAEIE